MTQPPMQPPAGWYPDPAGGDGERFWDGQAWSQSTRDRPTAPQWAPPQTPQPQATHVGRPNGFGGPVQPQAPGQPYGQPYPGQWQGRLVAAQGGRPLAGFWRRVLGYIIDIVVMTIIVAWPTSAANDRILAGIDSLMYRMLENIEDPTAPLPAIPQDLWLDVLFVLGVQFVLWSLYRTLTVRLVNASLGQKVMGLRVAELGDETLGRVGWKAAILRGVIGGVLYESIGFLAQISAAFSDRKQTIPDMLSKTVVINSREAL